MGQAETQVDRAGNSAPPNSKLPTSGARTIPSVWITHIQRIRAELESVESDLKGVKAADALALRARAEKLRNHIARLE